MKIPRMNRAAGKPAARFFLFETKRKASRKHGSLILHLPDISVYGRYKREGYPPIMWIKVTQPSANSRTSVA